MIPLPHDIWLHVAHFLPPLSLPDLLSVNRSFFEIGMDSRYRQLIFAYLDERMIKNLVRLQDPAVAKRVRILHIDPNFLPSSGSELFFSQSRPESPIKNRSIRSIFGEIANLLQPEQRTRHPRYRMRRSLKRREDIAQLLSEVLAGLPNVTDYYVSWYGSPPPTHLPASFLSSPFQSSLRKLSLNISLHNIPCLLAPGIHIPPQLEELHLSIHSEHVVRQRESDHILRCYLAPAINALQATLKTFVISSWEPSDLSPLFHNLAQFSDLGDLSINIPVEPCHLGDPSGLNGFLGKHHSSLRCLRLRPTQYGVGISAAGGGGGAADLDSLHEWISDAISGVNFANLRALDLASPLFPIDTSLVCLQQFSNRLTSLSLTGPYRSYDDVADALHLLMATYQTSAFRGVAIGSQLSSLRIGPVTLSPELVDLVAERLPHLRSLVLLVRDIYPSICDSMPPRGSPKVSKRKLIEAFFNEMECRRYPSWKLQQLAIAADMLPNRGQYETSLEQTFFQCIPSLRTFT
ncbi:hypothetical protein BKA70DRAFT_1253629 [Coprinopsis sp. MPI-PUGE-AT-0042]|nr:hypothetical protein BKA70DRAFT_1253629 [Coprinopsis sp. MPI-PUGE-AT-0042]